MIESTEANRALRALAPYCIHCGKEPACSHSGAVVFYHCDRHLKTCQRSRSCREDWTNGEHKGEAYYENYYPLEYGVKDEKISKEWDNLR